MLTAVAFLTRLPVRANAKPDLSRAAVFFPLVGLLVGAVAAGTKLLADQALPPLPATVLAVAAAIVVSGALHEDGLADVADALGAHTTRERRLEILKDPRVGAFGALALILATTLAITTLATLDTEDAVKALVISHVLSRWAILPVSMALKPAKRGGAGSLLRVTRPSLLAATVITAVIVTPLGGAPALAAAAGVTAACAIVLHTTFGGITGDGYGATAKAAELAALTTLTALWT
jgi:adenosylcobinamide-GDP ribazoletransferase